MTDLRVTPSATDEIRVIEISPNVVIAGTAFGFLLFTPYFGTIAALMFLVLGMILIVRQPARILPEHLRNLYLYLLPVFCALSVLWSEVPSASLRFSIQLGLTFAIAIAMASKVRAPAALKVLFVVYLIAALASLVGGRVRFDGALLGVFGSKNAFAGVMGTFVLLAASILFDRQMARAWRLTAFVALPAGLYLLVGAQSAGALYLTLTALGLIPLFYVVQRFSAVQRLVIAFFVVLLALLALIFLFAIRDVLFDLMLQYTGKDVTLTGRTDLWVLAFDLIAERPLLGVGYQAFWVHGNPNAEMFWEEFGIEARSGFNFHNTYINNAVEIGMIGVAIQSVILFGALWYTLRWAILKPNAVSVFFAIFMVQLIAASFIEVIAFFQFHVRSIIVLLALIYGLKAAREGRQVTAR